MPAHISVTRTNQAALTLFLITATWLALMAPVAGQTLSFHQSEFTGEGKVPPGWEVWSHRAATAPRAFVSMERSVGEPGSLAIAAEGNPAAHGGWHRAVPGVTPGRWYRLQAKYRSVSVPAENWQVVARIEWRSADGKRKDQPDYAAWSQREGEWTRLDGTFQAPEASTSAVLQFHLLHAPQGTVWWDDIRFEEVTPLTPRQVTVASVNLRPRQTGNKQASLAAFAETVRKQVPAGADLILLPEGITVVGTNRSYVDVAAPVPGEDTAFLGNLAREKKAYVAAGVYERDGDVVDNTSVLLDREHR